MMDYVSTHCPPLAALAAPAIVSFPPELIDLIHGFAGPENHLNFALACKKIAESSQNIFSRHQEASALYGVSSDLSPATVPTLLRKVVNDPIVAWNVHTFESWGSRSRWKDWTPFLSLYRREQRTVNDDISMGNNEGGVNGDVDTTERDGNIENDENEDTSERSGDESDDVRLRGSNSRKRSCYALTSNKGIHWYLRRADLERVIEYLQEDIGMSDSQAARAWDEIQKGCDGILKVLLFCLCPRLGTLRYASSGQAESNDARVESSSLNWLLKVIMVCHKNSHWPQGLHALRDVAIGIDSGFGAHTPQPPNLILGLLHLPRAKCLYIAGADQQWKEEGNNRNGLFECRRMSAGFASIEHLFFDHCDLTSNSLFRNSILRAPKKLVTFACRGGRLFGAEENMAHAAKEQGKNLETIILYKPTLWNNERFNCGLKGSDAFRNLRYFTLFMSNILRRAMCDLGFGRFRERDDTESQRTAKCEAFVKWFRDKPPVTTEVMVLVFTDHHGNLLLSAVAFDLVDDAIVGLLESGKYKNLKAIYFGPPVPHDKDSTLGQKTVAAGLKFGIDVYAPCNSRPPMHALAFPTPPEKYDLATGPWASQPRKGQVFDDETHRFVDDEREGDRIFDPCNGRWIIT